jgi:hypothetical protein
MCDRPNCTNPSVDALPEIVFFLYEGGLLRSKRYARRAPMVLGLRLCADCRAKTRLPIDVIGAEGLARLCDTIRHVSKSEIIDTELKWVGPESRDYQLMMRSRAN